MWWIVGSALWVFEGVLAFSTYDPQTTSHGLQKPNKPNKRNEPNELNELKEPNKPNEPNEPNEPLGYNNGVVGSDGDILIQILAVGDFFVIHPDGHILAVFLP